MPDLFHTPVLEIEGPSSQRDFRLMDAQGTVLATAAQVGTPPKNALQRFLRSGDTSRVVLQVTAPDGVPLFFADRPAYQPSIVKPPCAIVAPEGSLIGRVEHDTAGYARHLLDSGFGEVVHVFKLMDASGRQLASATYEGITRRQGAVDQYAVGGRYCVYTDMNGTEIGRLDVGKRSTLRLPYLLPDPLRLLVIASPLAFGLLVD